MEVGAPVWEILNAPLMSLQLDPAINLEGTPTPSERESESDMTFMIVSGLISVQSGMRKKTF